MRFEFKNLGEINRCLGIEFTREKNRIVMHQTVYISEILDRFNMCDCKAVATPIDSFSKHFRTDNINCDDKKLPYREIIGSLMYLSIATRPDISHAVSNLSQYVPCYNKSHWIAAKRVLRYLKGTINLGICF